MNEGNTECINLTQFELKGLSRLIVLLGSKEGIRGFSKKIKQLSMFSRVSKGLFIVDPSQGNYADIIQSVPTLSFIRTREVPAIKVKLENSYANRAYSIVSYSFSNPSPGQKKRVERLIRQSAGIRLRPGVLLFPVLRARERRKLTVFEKMPKLLDSKEFSNYLKSMGATSIRWSRLRLVNSSDSKLIEEAIEKTFTRDILPLELRIQEIRERCKNPEVSTRILKKQSALLSRRYRKLKFKWILAKTLWHYDAEKPLKRIYNLGLSTKYMIENRVQAAV